ncbi:type II toxin-antitoxin system VapC family toxin [Metallosphaera javensis (ex Sakai et al. 2022)]|uniref:type II toxin-antitoxin system VapC family toxin n=1 Tax=Metallosphaera javensis (ex Sakai et al. 2022) TaxID=2775498 RepID=UPI00258ACE05|nr:MAG: PIN domain nuclease [Metallosphaera javensis (ex Sakai et al. 2022)]
MNYVDTNVILSFVEKDSNHDKARKILEFDNLITGEITLIELSSFFSRKIKDRVRAKASMLYAIQATKVRVIEIDNNELIRKSTDLSTRLQLKTLDVLQITSAYLLKAENFLTFDKDIIGKKDLIAHEVGIEIITD